MQEMIQTRNGQRSVVEIIRSSKVIERWKPAYAHRLTILVLILSDVLLALVVWQAAMLLQDIWGQGPISDITLATLGPILAAWIGLRALLGLYPGYGLDMVEELRRHTYSVFAAVALTTIFAFAFQFGHLLSRLLLLAGFAGLLLTAPLARYFAAQGLRKLGLWGKPVIIVGSKESGARLTELLHKKWELGYDPVAVFDYHLSPTDRFLEDYADNVTLDSISELTPNQTDTIIFATPHTRREQVARLVKWASVSFRDVIVIPNLAGITNSAVTARNLGGTSG